MSKASEGQIRPSGSTKKRAADIVSEVDGAPDRKRAKVFPIFEKPGTQKADAESIFHWISPALGSKKTCLHGVNLSPESRPKIAAFDLDGCLIQSSVYKKSTGPPQFQWWRSSIPKKLKEVHEAGYAIVIMTNQALRSAALADWKKKVPLIGGDASDVPFRIFAATARDEYRKPMPGMWYELERIYASDSVQIDRANSFFVGDAAGRACDHAGTDRKWALNVGIAFHTPEEYFLNLPNAPYTLSGFHVSSLPSDLPHITPPDATIVPPSLETPEVVVFVGFPSLGKSTFYRKYFASAGYAHVNQDTLRTRDKCVKAAEEAVHEGKSCVIDNTNRNAETRRYYVEVARKAKIPVRCIVFDSSIELAWHNNLYRAFNLPPTSIVREPKRDLLPYNAFTGFRAQYEEPQSSEGFAEIVHVNWVFEGDEEEKRRWSMWLQIDGK
ncbi:uncharacterized protein FIBRA_02174 [Fibroporia radiculosa]|uniref:PNK FHA domain-containing protein n=1 Tax=Fibroporia radiculosa TaxID=599839 RepID=J4HUH2_9APHY|nr:uncharacterized protein FIBRA_02174 [Fibroporia radiculosa]CCM00147.1 predicted protein [Fibroporia radiculosa]